MNGKHVALLLMSSPVAFIIVYFTLIGEYAGTFTALIFGTFYVMVAGIIIDILGEY